MGKDEVNWRAQSFAAQVAGVFVDTDSRQAAEDMVGRAVEVRAPLARDRPYTCGRQFQFDGSRDWFLSNEHLAAAVVARPVHGFLIGAGHDHTLGRRARISTRPIGGMCVRLVLRETGHVAASNDERRDALLALIEGVEPIADSLERLSRFPWDSQEELALLRAEHVVRVLRAFRADRLTEQDVQAWADALEVRDDVAIEREHDDDLKQALFELSAPEANGPMSELADRWLARLTVLD